MDSSPPRSSGSAAAPVTGVKRPASLLPAFEPLSSSPSLPRPQKRVARDSNANASAAANAFSLTTTYPTPLPTSSTHILSSSPPRTAAATGGGPLSRPVSRRAFLPATSSERVPLSAVPTVMLSETGEPALMGRSSASCHHQLSANRMISRVHVKAAYKPAPNPFDRDRIEIMCVGWNGIKLHCQGKTYDLAKGKTFTSDIKDADIMIDIHDARVLVQWPRNDDERKHRAASITSDQTWDEDPPTNANANHYQNKKNDIIQDDGSVHADQQRLASPVSPSPALQSSQVPPSSPLIGPKDSHNSVVVYEDEPEPEPSPSRRRSKSAAGIGALEPSESGEERVAQILDSSQSSDLSDLSKPDDGLSDHDEENDPIVHSFGPFGDNILPRMASFTAYESPTRSAARSAHTRLASQPAKFDQSSKQSLGPSGQQQQRNCDSRKPEPELAGEHVERIRNHAVNQLAFSRLSSTPFSTIVSNLPPSLRERDSRSKGTTRDEIRCVIDSTECIGKVAREGKDAAGKPLESEYYYIADFDQDEMRRDAVVYELRKPGLRSCRKQHKQYFWRKPK